MGRAEAAYHVWYYDGTRFHIRPMAYMSHPGNKIIIDHEEYEITDIWWTPGAAPHCVQEVRYLGPAPVWAKRLRWH